MIKQMGKQMAGGREMKPKEIQKTFNDLFDKDHDAGITYAVTSILHYLAEQETPDKVTSKDNENEMLLDACMWYRHDFGLLDEKYKHIVIQSAKYWLQAFKKAGFIKQEKPDKVTSKDKTLQYFEEIEKKDPYEFYARKSICNNGLQNHEDFTKLCKLYETAL
jgi:hypothetical protein